jgi:hypothetical protein
MVAQQISVRPTNGWSLGDEVTRRDIEILRHCEEVVRTPEITDERRQRRRATRHTADESTISRLARRGAHSVHRLVRQVSELLSYRLHTQTLVTREHVKAG